jgi:hypothetical protein
VKEREMRGSKRGSKRVRIRGGFWFVLLLLVTWV